jgi:hypothetical protein
MSKHPLLGTSLGAVLLIAAVLPGSGMANDRTHLAVIIAGGEPIRAAASWNSGMADDDAFVVWVLDSRGTATGWTVNLVTHGSFQVEGTVGTATGAPSPGVISVDQGNQSLGGHDLVLYRTDTPSDAIRWSVARFFGDGEYRLTVPGRPILPASGIATVVMTICGGAP